MKLRVHVHVHIHNIDHHLTLDKNVILKSDQESTSLNSTIHSSRFENDLSVHKNQPQDWPSQNTAKSAHLTHSNVQDYNKVQTEDYKKKFSSFCKRHASVVGKTVWWLATVALG